MNLANRAASARNRRHATASETALGVAGHQLAAVAWPSTRRDRLFGSWHYCGGRHTSGLPGIDAQLRDPPGRSGADQPPGQNSTGSAACFSWLSSYYDDARRG